jgi:hypothetical protein
MLLESTPADVSEPVCGGRSAFCNLSRSRGFLDHNAMLFVRLARMAVEWIAGVTLKGRLACSVRK